MNDSSDCPGRFKCHGPAGWCDLCGDVDLICDDPKCDIHQRGREREAAWKQADMELRNAMAEFERAKKQEQEARAHFERWKNGNPVMVGRKP